MLPPVKYNWNILPVPISNIGELFVVPALSIYQYSIVKGVLLEILKSEDFLVSLNNQILTNKAWELLEDIALNQKKKSKVAKNQPKKTSKTNTKSLKNKKSTKK